MIILSIETSCDDTSVAIVEVLRGKFKILANVVSSQIKKHEKYGGVVPNLAAREHVGNLGIVMEAALKEAGVRTSDVDLIAVTQGPGLIPALMVGSSFAQALSFFTDIPVIGVNHMEGHIYANFIANKKITFPVMNLIVSGGHTMLVLMTDHGKYKLIGRTLDDAAGEAFDKVARILGMKYPGGPEISREAESYDQSLELDLPRPMLNKDNYDFSFSGLKTAVLYLVDKLKKEYPINKIRQAVSNEFQNAVVEVLVRKTIKAAIEFNVKTILLSGGVAANKSLRQALLAQSKEADLNFIAPDLAYTTDNAAMIAAAGYFNFMKKNKKIGWKTIRPDANLKLVK